MSDDKAEELKKNILSPSQWIRILFMVFYAIACWVLTIVLTVIIIAQILISLITGQDNENLRKVGKKVSDYFHELLDYLVYASDEKPWPFSEEDGDFSDDHEPGPANTPPVADAPTADNSTVTSADSPEDQGASEDQNNADDVFADISFTSVTEDLEITEAGKDDVKAQDDDDKRKD